MSWLSKLFSKSTVTELEQMAKEVVEEMPSAQCAAVALDSVADDHDTAAEQDENPTKQRRYFVKTGTYVDHEEEAARARAANSSDEETPDRRPVDLKTLFPKLSLR
jgi:hypothetical protein